MMQFQTDFTDTHRSTDLQPCRGKRRWLAVAKLGTAWISVFVLTAQAQSPRSSGFQTPPASSHFDNEDVHPAGSLKLKAKGLLPNSVFRVFLAGNFLGEIAANTDGRGSMHAMTLVEGDWFRMNLRTAALRFTSRSSNDLCFTPEHNEDEGIDSFHRNVRAQRSASVTTTLITNSRSMNDDGSIFHTINWRSHPCVSTF